MSRTRIKICGVCRVEDAVVAATRGADAVGMIRVPAAGRYIEMELARSIAQALPAFVTPVLVYMNTPAELILQELKLLGRPATVQLNGEETPELIQRLKDVPVLRAVRMDAHARANLQTLREAKTPNLLGVVLESPQQMGGSGVGNDWAMVRTLQAERAFDGFEIIAAGGLTPESVAEVVRNIRPFAVDVSSGVEERKREKSAKRISAFVQAVREADPPEPPWAVR